MRYARATIEVIFQHEDNVPAPFAAGRILRNVMRGDVVGVTGVMIEPATERDVITANGGCGECEGCQTMIAEMVVPGYSGTASSEAEDAAIERAQGA